MSTEANKVLVLRFIDEVVNGRRLELVDEMLADDFTLPPNDADALTRDGFRDVLAYYFAAFSDLHYTVEEVVADGDTVVTRLKMRGTQDGEYDGHSASGRHVEVDEIDVLRIADGRIADWRIVWDELGFRRQLGLPVSAA